MMGEQYLAVAYRDEEVFDCGNYVCRLCTQIVRIGEGKSRQAGRCSTSLALITKQGPVPQRSCPTLTPCFVEAWDRAGACLKTSEPVDADLFIGIRVRLAHTWKKIEAHTVGNPSKCYRIGVADNSPF